MRLFSFRFPFQTFWSSIFILINSNYDFIYFRFLHTIALLLTILFSTTLATILDCDFRLIRLLGGKQIYKCLARNLIIDSRNDSVSAVSGALKEGKSSGAVNILIIENQICNYLPGNLNLHFPEAYHFDINNSSLKVVTVDDMSMFPKLMHLYIRNNEIETISSDLFLHNPRLTFINLNGNHIKQIGSNAFPLSTLVSLSIEANECIDGFAMQTEALMKLVAEIERNCSQSSV